MLYTSLAREEQEVSTVVMNRKSAPCYCKAIAHLNFFRRAIPVLHHVWQLVWRSENFNKLPSARAVSLFPVTC
jgi:hypothetical protein